MQTFLEIIILILAAGSSLLPLLAKRKFPQYGEYAAWITIFCACLILAAVSTWLFALDFMTAFVRAVIIVALPYGSSLHWIDRKLLSGKAK